MRLRYHNRVPGKGRSSTVKIFRSPDKSIKDDTRIIGEGPGRQIIAVCPECGTSRKAVKAGSHNSGLNGFVPGIKKGDLLIGSHSVGGGFYSVLRGDALCKGVGMPVVITSLEEN